MYVCTPSSALTVLLCSLCSSEFCDIIHLVHTAAVEPDLALPAAARSSTRGPAHPEHGGPELAEEVGLVARVRLHQRSGPGVGEQFLVRFQHALVYPQVAIIVAVESDGRGEVEVHSAGVVPDGA